MVEKKSGEKVFDRCSIRRFDNEGPVFTSKEGGCAETNKYAWLYFYFEDADVGKLGTPTVAVEGADIRMLEQDDSGFAIQLDGDKFREMSTINVSYEVPDSLGNVTTGSISCQKYQWDRYPVLGGPNYCSINYSDTNYSFNPIFSSAPNTYGTLALTGDKQYYVFTQIGSLVDYSGSKTALVGYYARTTSGDVYRISGVASNGGSYYADRVYKAEPARPDTGNDSVDIIDINESLYPDNGQQGSIWYIKK